MDNAQRASLTTEQNNRRKRCKLMRSEDEIKSLLARVCPEHLPFVKDEIMYTEREIKQRAKEMADEISAKYRNEILKPGEHLMVVGLLKGAIPFMNDLCMHLTVPTILDYIGVHSYEGTDTTNTVNFRSDMMVDPVGKHVLVVDDIIDTGGTLLWCKEHLMQKNPASIQIACMLDKKERRKHAVEADYVGYVIPNKFVVGYGLDLNQAFRSIPFVAVYNKAK